MEDGLPWCPLTSRALPLLPLPLTVCGRVRVCLVKTACLIIITFRTAADTRQSMPRPLLRAPAVDSQLLFVPQMNRSF